MSLAQQINRVVAPFEVISEFKPAGDQPAAIADPTVPIPVQTAYSPVPPDAKGDQAAKIIANAKNPVILAGNGVIRQGAADLRRAFSGIVAGNVKEEGMRYIEQFGCTARYRALLDFTRVLALGGRRYLA